MTLPVPPEHGYKQLHELHDEAAAIIVLSQLDGRGKCIDEELFNNNTFKNPKHGETFNVERNDTLTDGASNYLWIGNFLYGIYGNQIWICGRWVYINVVNIVWVAVRIPIPVVATSSDDAMDKASTHVEMFLKANSRIEKVEVKDK